MAVNLKLKDEPPSLDGDGPTSPQHHYQQSSRVTFKSHLVGMKSPQSSPKANSSYLPLKPQSPATTSLLRQDKGLTQVPIRKRSKGGCITCKIRKKRCDEVKPVCGDCVRLKRKCAYVTDDMSPDEVRHLKVEMEAIEEDSKTRRRRPKSLTVLSSAIKAEQTTNRKDNNHKVKIIDYTHQNQINKGTKKRKIHSHSHASKASDKVVFNPLAMEMPPFQLHTPNMPPAPAPATHTLPSTLPVTTDPFPQDMQAPPATDSIFGNSTTTNWSSNVSADIHQVSTGSIPIHLPIPSSAPANPSNNLINFQIPSPILNGVFSPRLVGTPHVTPYDQINTLNPEIKSMTPLLPTQQQQQHQHQHQQQHTQDEHTETNNIQPLSLESPGLDGLSGLLSPDFSKLFQKRLKSEDIEELDDNTNKKRPVSIQLASNTDNSLVRLSPGSSFSQLQDLFDFAPNLGSLILSSQKPEIYTNPSIVINTTLATLSPMGTKLYEYYRDRLCTVVSSAPKVENMYLNTFLPMAHVNRSVLYGILAWSAFHLGGPQMEKQGNYYIQQAIEGFIKHPLFPEENQETYRQVFEDVDCDDDEVVQEVNPQLDPPHVQHQLALLSQDDLINMRLASFMILCGVEICKGDVSKWSNYLNFGAQLIQKKGGLKNFNASKDEHFLATNYAYHDINSATTTDRELHFKLEEYKEMWHVSNTLGFLDPLHGVSAPIFGILAEINNLVMHTKMILKKNSEALNVDTDDDEANDDFMSFASLEDSSPLSEDLRAAIERAEDQVSAHIEPTSVKLSSTATQEISPTDESPKSTSSSSTNWYQKHSDDKFEPEKHIHSANYDVYEDIMGEAYTLDARLDSAKPNEQSLAHLNRRDLELQLTMFECFQLTARIHLRQSVMRTNSSSLEIQYLVSQLIKSVDIMLGSDVEACLCFPMFIAGMNCIYKKDKREMNKRFNEFIKRYKWKNVLRCQIIMKHVWRLNPNGDKCVDWYEIVRRLDWDLSFA